MKRFTPQHWSSASASPSPSSRSARAWPPVCTGFDEKSSIHREVFGDIPDALKMTFYIVIPVLLVYGAVLFAYRVRNWERGAPDNRATTAENVKRRLDDFRAGVYMQTLLRDPAAGIMHSLIYFWFLVLLAVTTVLEINHQLPDEPSSCTARPTRPTPSWATSPASSSSSASSWPSSAATYPRPTASASSPSPSTP